MSEWPISSRWQQYNFRFTPCSKNLSTHKQISLMCISVKNGTQCRTLQIRQVQNSFSLISGKAPASFHSPPTPKQRLILVTVHCVQVQLMQQSEERPAEFSTCVSSLLDNSPWHNWVQKMLYSLAVQTFLDLSQIWVWTEQNYNWEKKDKH